MFNGRYKHPTQAFEVKENENPTITAIRGLATLITKDTLERAASIKTKIPPFIL